MLKNLAARALLLVTVAAALGATSCAHTGPVIADFSDCAAPEIAEAGGEWKERLVDVLACSGLQTEMLPPCVVAGVIDLYRDHGRVVVDCAIIAIRDSFSAPKNATPEQIARVKLVRARAAEVIKREEARGVRFVARPGT